MIDHAALPQISQILTRLDIPHGRSGRTICPVHHGENNQAFAFDDERGVWYCHRCGFGGDAVELVRRVLNVEFKDALRWLGVEPGKPPKPDPIHTQAQTIRENLRAWKRRIGRQSRDLLAARSELEVCGMVRLEADRDDEAGWQLLAAAFKGYDRDEHIADCIAQADKYDDVGLLCVYRELGASPYGES